jgi:hypothetical protein
MQYVPPKLWIIHLCPHGVTAFVIVLYFSYDKMKMEEMSTRGKTSNVITAMLYPLETRPLGQPIVDRRITGCEKRVHEDMDCVKWLRIRSDTRLL